MAHHKGLFDSVSFCAGLPTAAIRALEAIAFPMTYAERELIQIEGEPATAMYVVATGRVKVSRLSAGGREQVLAIIDAGGHFNAVPIFDGGPCPANVEALAAVTLLVLPRDALLGAVEAHPELARALLDEFAGRLRHLVDLVDTLALHTVQGRLAGLLLDQAAAVERGEPVAPLTQAEMASHLGTVREMVSRTLKSFEALGLIALERGTITVRDRAGLEAQREL
jgi:CRP/FNR family transcriptional regulator, cyclic AMP receptor protein